MRPPLLFLAALVATGWGTAPKRELPFPVMIVGWDSAALRAQGQAYLAEAAEHEVLYCIASWRVGDVRDGVEPVVIDTVRRAKAGEPRSLDGFESLCHADDGTPLPIFHTHSDGNCQFSPRDLITAVARQASFDGIQCGERHFVWVSAWQIQAMAAAVENERAFRARKGKR